MTMSGVAAAAAPMTTATTTTTTTTTTTEGATAKRARSDQDGEEEGEGGEEEEEEEDPEVLEEECRVWRKNSPFLYDFCLEKKLDKPSLTVQWLPHRVQPSNEPGCDWAESELLLGTQNADEGGNFLVVAKVLLPKEDTALNAKAFEEEQGGLAGYASGRTKILTDARRIRHDGDVDRARYMPQDCFIVATRMGQGDVGIFDISAGVSSSSAAASSSSEPLPLSPSPLIRCKGHSSSSFGLDWSPASRGKLLTCSGDDNVVLMWDVDAPLTKKENVALPLRTFDHAAVMDCAFHPTHKDVFASVSADGAFLVWDVRESSSSSSSSSSSGVTTTATRVSGELNAVRFSPFNEHLVATGGSENVVHLWDTRKLGGQPTHTLCGHTKEIYQVAWSPFHADGIASCGKDRRVILWDLSRIGQEQSVEDAEDGVPEMIFMHGGHLASVYDVAWNPTDDWVLASVDVDGVVQVWEPNDTVLGGGDGDDDDGDGDGAGGGAAATSSSSGANGASGAGAVAAEDVELE